MCHDANLEMEGSRRPQVRVSESYSVGGVGNHAVSFLARRYGDSLRYGPHTNPKLLKALSFLKP